ncbi:WxL protein peptidoglycan domain-containing protein [Actinoplanes sp. NPDC000266]
MRLFRILVVVLAVASGLVPGAAASADTLTWSVRPTPATGKPDRPNFVYDLKPGQTISDSIRVRNYGDKPLSLSVYASDALTTSSGALDLLPAGTKPTDVGKWVVLKQQKIEVPAQKFVDVPFTMTVPDKAESGDHTGGLVTSYVSLDNHDRAVTVDRRLGTRMYVRVSGPLMPQLDVSAPKLSYAGNLNPFGPGKLHVTYTVTNTGNVRMGAEQVVATSFPGGETSLPPMPELLPGDKLTFSADVDGVWPTFRTKAEVRLKMVPTRQGDVFDVPVVAVDASAWTLPFPQLAVVLIGVLTLVFVLWRRRSRRSSVDRQIEEAVRAALLEKTS